MKCKLNGKLKKNPVSQLPSKTFCILPWVHFFHDPTGNIKPCCAAGGKQSFGNINEFSDVQAIANTPAMRQVRADMLAGIENDACIACYREERLGLQSFRTNKNSDAGDYNIDELVARTNSDGTLPDFKLQYWDSRFSNICNLKCRMCGPEYSHSWTQELFPDRKSYVIQAHTSDSWDDIVAKYGDLSELKEAYFAGGEALFQPEHWDLLEHLIKLNKTDIKITYTTNLTKLTFGSRKIEDYLDKFTNVLFIVSVDAVGPLGEYIRHGLDWARLVDNINTIKQFLGVKLRFNTVITAYNILYLNQLIEFASGMLDEYWPIDLTVAHNLDLSITNLPAELKQLAQDRLLNSKHYLLLKDKIDGVINYLNQEPADTWESFIKTTNNLDAKRNENILEVVPEFVPYWDNKY